MTSRRFGDLRMLQGRQVGVALADGTRIDDATLVSAGPRGKLWLFSGGVDVFVRATSVVEAWEWSTGAHRVA